MYNLGRFGIAGVQCLVHRAIPTPPASGCRRRVVLDVDGGDMDFDLSGDGRDSFGADHGFLLKKVYFLILMYNLREFVVGFTDDWTEWR